MLRRNTRAGRCTLFFGFDDTMRQVTRCQKSVSLPQCCLICGFFIAVLHREVFVNRLHPHPDHVGHLLTGGTRYQELLRLTDDRTSHDFSASSDSAARPRCGQPGHSPLDIEPLYISGRVSDTDYEVRPA